ncbi:extracellular solute-binding protein [Candidatus Wolfebacteria bacterium]|nr:extracellular solute-binding protein [Candidatus Wolfebacteria bacterium]
MNLSRNQIIIIGIIGLVVLFFILMLLGIIPGLKKSGNNGGFGSGTAEQTEIVFWGVSDADNSDAIKKMIDEYALKGTGIKITYRVFNSNNYESSLLNALATGQAPDIFMFHNSWLSKHSNKVAPIPESYLPLSQFRQLFPTVVEQNFVSAGRIYSLPLYIDTLAFIYNKDIFDSKSIAVPPKTWQDFQNLISQLKQVNALNQIIKPAAALGGSEKNINSASNLLMLLMLQFGSQMVSQYNEIIFGSEGLSALNFYLQFSNPSSSYYTWNQNLRNSLDSFAEGSTAVIFDYSSSIPLIKAKNPYINIGVSPMLQTSNPDQNQPINYANYWGLSVSNQSKKQNAAWNFVFSATIDSQISEVYVQTGQKPPALRSLIEKYKNDSNIGVFAKQSLTARSWPQPDYVTTGQIFSNMLEYVLNGRLNPEQALKQAENELNSL